MTAFSGERDGYFFALDGKNGNLLWKQSLGGQVNSGPMSYMVNNRQYIVMAVGAVGVPAEFVALTLDQ